MSLQLKTLIIQAFKAICELLAEGEIHWTSGEVGHRNSTNPLAKRQIRVYTGGRSAFGSFLGTLKDLMCQADPGKDVLRWVICPGVQEGLELLLSLRQNVGRKEMLGNSLPSAMSLTSRQLDATSARPCLQTPSKISKSPLVEPPRIRALRVVPSVDPLTLPPSTRS